MTTPESPTSHTHLMVSWPAVALSAIVLAISAFVVVVIVTESDQTLSTVAIILAIIAFIVQIIVFIVQLQVAETQSRESHRLYGEMQGTLARIQERTEGTQESLIGLNDRLLEAALGKALPQAQKTSAQNPDDLIRDTAERMANIIREQGHVAPEEPEPSLRRGGGEYPRRTRTPEEDAGAHAFISTMPERDELDGAIERLERLSPEGLTRLYHLGADERTSTGPNFTLVPGLGRLTLDDELFAERLAQESHQRLSDGGALTVLTDDGRALARALVADDGNEPLPPELGQLRQLVRP